MSKRSFKSFLATVALLFVMGLVSWGVYLLPANVSVWIAPVIGFFFLGWFSYKMFYDVVFDKGKP